MAGRNAHKHRELPHIENTRVHTFIFLKANWKFCFRNSYTKTMCERMQIPWASGRW